MTHTCAALTLAASILLLPSCDTSKDYGSSTSDDPIPASGVWVLQSRVLSSECEPEVPERRLTVNIVQSGQSASVFVDLDSDGSFGELVELPGTVRGEQLHAAGLVDRAGIRYHLDLTLDWIVWGSMTGGLMVTNMPPTGSSVPPCITNEAVTAIKISNPPLFDLSGAWAVTQTVSFASGPLQALAGSAVDVDWDIAQESGNLLRGIFHVASSDTRRYLGVVNDTQIILGGTFAAWGQEFHITYSTLNANGDDMSGQLLARYGADKEFEIGWNIVALRQAGGNALALLEVGASEAGTVAVRDDLGRAIEFAHDSIAPLRTRLVPGVFWIEKDGQRLPVLARPGARIALDFDTLGR
ncbi:MAG: hypothetical protein FJ294_09295 [Planctomycetes bacterium]|nr:hypothetical protein [Planctomycetota bacterium]